MKYSFLFRIDTRWDIYLIKMIFPYIYPSVQQRNHSDAHEANNFSILPALPTFL
jgi:hypothetical protein